MKTLACGTKQLKSVIAKENLKKPKQTQKKTSEQIVFVGLWAWYFLESQNLTVVCGISKMLIGGGLIHDDNSEQGQIHDDWLICLAPWNFKKAKMAG